MFIERLMKLASEEYGVNEKAAPTTGDKVMSGIGGGVLGGTVGGLGTAVGAELGGIGAHRIGSRLSQSGKIKAGGTLKRMAARVLRKSPCIAGAGALAGAAVGARKAIREDAEKKNGN